MSDEHLKDVLTQQPAEWGLPDPSRDCEPFSRPWNQPLYTLHCIVGPGTYRSYQYVHLDSSSSLSVDGTGHVIRLRFCGSKTWAVTICGRNLWRLFDYIHQHRIAFVMAVDPGRDFGEDDEPVVTDIKIEEVNERKDGEPAA
jgi:hypothetical protein